jgi:hypothetical protein
LGIPSEIYQTNFIPTLTNVDAALVAGYMYNDGFGNPNFSYAFSHDGLAWTYQGVVGIESIMSPTLTTSPNSNFMYLAVGETGPLQGAALNLYWMENWVSNFNTTSNGSIVTQIGEESGVGLAVTNSQLYVFYTSVGDNQIRYKKGTYLSPTNGAIVIWSDEFIMTTEGVPTALTDRKITAIYDNQNDIIAVIWKRPFSGVDPNRIIVAWRKGMDPWSYTVLSARSETAPNLAWSL